MDIAIRYLAALFDGYRYSSEQQFEMRAFGKTSHRPAQRHYALTEKGYKAAATLATKWRRDADVYIGVLPRRTGGDKDADVTAAHFLFCDLDAGQDGSKGALELLFRWKDGGWPIPSLIVHSGSGGFHLYWELEGVKPLQSGGDRLEYSSLLKRLCTIMGGVAPLAHADTSCTNPSRILRLPGTYNHKHDPPHPVHIQFVPSEPMPFGQWDSLLPKPPPQKVDFRDPISGVLPNGFLAPWVQVYAEKGFAEGNRHKDLISTAAWLVRDKGLTKADALDVVWRKAQRSPGAREITRREVEDMIGWT